MKRASNFVISSNWKLLLTDMGIDPTAALTLGGLPVDLFHRDNASLSPSEYFQLWEGIDQAAGQREFALLFAKHFSVEAFDPPIFASLCSPNFTIAAKRLSHYKPLIGPMILDVEEQPDVTKLSIECYGHEGALPASLTMAELVFFTQLIRLATRENIIPRYAALPELPNNMEPYNQFFGCKLTKSNSKTIIAFDAKDANRPFLTSNAPMWEFFEGTLNQKLADLDSSASTTRRTRAILLEALPSGECSIDFVANKLAISKRTLQRKLTAEAESFQSILLAVRSELADHYLEKSDMSLGEISFMLGFQESNSFIRAYASWKGISPGYYRENLKTNTHRKSEIN